MGGEVIRGTGGNRPTPFIPRGVEANVGEPLRRRPQPIVPHQHLLEVQLAAREVRVLREEVDVLILEVANLLHEAVNQQERGSRN